MTRFIVGCLSVFIFMLGSLALTLAAAAAWLSIVALAASQTHWTVGAAGFVASLAAARWRQDIIAAPWILWHELWRRLDAELEERMR